MLISSVRSVTDLDNMPEYICPHCKKPINDDDAVLCLYCGESLNRSIGTMGKLRYPKPKVIILIVVSLILLSFIVLMIR